MSIKISVLCDRCGFESTNRNDFGDCHFTRMTDDGEDRTEYFHLCHECQAAITRRIVVPEIALKTVAKSQYEGVSLINSFDVFIYGFTTHKGIII